jgi:hypothetical protein
MARLSVAVVAVVVAVVSAIAAAAWWFAGQSSEPRTEAPAADSRTLHEAGSVPTEGRATADAGRHSPGEAAMVPRDNHTDTPAPRRADPSSVPSPTAKFAWPGLRRGGVATTKTTSVAALGTPAVPVKLAFRALWYLGVDPEAERTWARAINDANHPEGVRSDLIVDMVDEGYSDNSRPTKADLPLIAARLDILERHAPFAMDEGNRRAFEAAYQGLLTLYIRLGGLPRANTGTRR